MMVEPKKKKKRVSFNIPDEAQAVQPDEPTKITVSINDPLFDEDVETVDDHSDPDDSDTCEGLQDTDSVDDRPATDANQRGLAELTEDNFMHQGSSSDSEESEDSDSDSLGKEADQVASGDESDAGTATENGDDGRNQSSELKDSATETPPPVSTFSEMKLDPRVERAIEVVGWSAPTPVQAAVIPAALQGRDVLVHAPTGSGKTAAYGVPIAQYFCRSSTAPRAGARALVLVPTRELVHQVFGVLRQLCRFIEGIHVSTLSAPKRKVNGANRGRDDKEKHDNRSARAADIVVGTPASMSNLCNNTETNPLSDVEFVVVDEADLVLSYGYESDTKLALSKVPTSAQALLVSATLDADGMDRFRKIILRRPLTVKVSADRDVNADITSSASHYFSRLPNHKDRFLVTYAMLRLSVICGKALIFVNHINAAFKLKLFLDQFKVKTAVLNSELPANSRIHCVEQFNAGIVDILIAADESNHRGVTYKNGGSKKEVRKRKRIEKDEEFGLARGVDFRNVSVVLNFDAAETVESYTHRAGRTARGGKSGTVLSLVCSSKEEEGIKSVAQNTGIHIGPLAFRMSQIESFRYRVEDCLRMVTDAAVQGARIADVRRELMNSEQLKDHFDENPADLDALQHNVRLAKNVSDHLGHIPSYLVPVALRSAFDGARTGVKAPRKRKGKRVSASDKRNADPLRGFSLSGSSRDRYREKHGIVKKNKSKNDGRAVRPKKHHKRR